MMPAVELEAPQQGAVLRRTDVLQRNNVSVSGAASGRPLVFAHGLGCDQSVWRRMTATFAADHPIVLLDHVGAGGSNLTAQEPTRYDRTRHRSTHARAPDAHRRAGVDRPPRPAAPLDGPVEPDLLEDLVDDLDEQYAVMLFVLSTAFGVFGRNPISDYLRAVIGYLPKVFVAILILVIASAVAAGVKLLVQNALGGLSYGKFLANAASVVIIALGVIAALNQLEIARNVVDAVLYALLAAVVGVTVVAVGGGGIAPMRQRWEQALATVQAEGPRAVAQARGTDPADAVRTEAQGYAGTGGSDTVSLTQQPGATGGATRYGRQ